MAIYAVTYDLKSPGQSYDKVTEYLKQCAHCKYLESFWLIDTLKNPRDIRDELSKLTDSNDIVFIARISREWAAQNYPCGGWLNDSSRRW